MPGFVAQSDGTTSEILVRDLSYDGCGIEVSVPLQVGEVIKLSVMGRPAALAGVRWYSKGRAGLVFGVEAASVKAAHTRTSERVDLHATVTTRRLGRARYRVQIKDLSREGCKIELVERARVGETLFIKFAGFEGLRVVVCWSDVRYAGVRFENAIHPAVFDLMLTRFGSIGTD